MIGSKNILVYKWYTNFTTHDTVHAHHLIYYYLCIIILLRIYRYVYLFQPHSNEWNFLHVCRYLRKFFNFPYCYTYRRYLLILYSPRIAEIFITIYLLKICKNCGKFNNFNIFLRSPFDFILLTFNALLSERY